MCIEQQIADYLRFGLQKESNISFPMEYLKYTKRYSLNHTRIEYHIPFKIFSDWNLVETCYKQHIYIVLMVYVILRSSKISIFMMFRSPKKEDLVCAERYMTFLCHYMA